MKKLSSVKISLLLLISFYTFHAGAQKPVNWTDKQLMQPSELANIIKTKTNNITIISVGPFNTIPGAVNVGMVSEKKTWINLKRS